MLSEAIAIAAERERILTHDKLILQNIDSLEPDITWKQIGNIESETLRYAAIKEYLEMLFHGGIINWDEDARIQYTLWQFDISLPTISSSDQTIYVVYKNTIDIRKPITMPISKTEQALTDYISLLERKASIPEKVRLRMRTSLSDVRLRHNYQCYLYYIFVLFPKDLILGRHKINWWKDRLSKLQNNRKIEEEQNLITWRETIDSIDGFRFGTYLNLQKFRLPIRYGVPGQSIPIEELFASIEK